MSRESVALDLLKHPERFPSLPQRFEYERQICLWITPSFEPHSSWSIFEDLKTKAYFVRRLEHDPSKGLPVNTDDPHVYGAEAPISESLVCETLRAFEAIQVPMFRRPAWGGIDGVLYGVHIGNYWQSTTVCWWSSFSPEWTPLNELFKYTSQRLDELLPTSTLRYHKKA